MPESNVVEEIFAFVRTVIFIALFLLYDLIFNTMKRRNNRPLAPDPSLAESSKAAQQREDAMRVRAPPAARGEEQSSTTWPAGDGRAQRADSPVRAFSRNQSSDSRSSQSSIWEKFADLDDREVEMLLLEPSKVLKSPQPLRRTETDTTLVDADDPSQRFPILSRTPSILAGTKRTISEANVADSLQESSTSAEPARKKKAGVASPFANASTSKTVSENSPVAGGSRRVQDEPNPFQETPGKTSPPNIVNIASLPGYHGYIGKLSWGTTWELARLLANGMLNPDDFDNSLVDKLVKLKGSSEVMAPRVTASFRSNIRTSNQEMIDLDSIFTTDKKTVDPYKELDREDAALKAGLGDGLGCNSVSGDWYGGKVLQVARLISKSKGIFSNAPPSYTIRLDKQTLGRSHRVSRYYGSRRVIQVTIPKSILNKRGNGLYDYFVHNAFVIFGRTFRAVFAKDRHVYLVETNEDIGRIPSDDAVDAGRKSLEEFIKWHNDITVPENTDQPLSKWASRFALALSTSEPVLRFESFHPRTIPDIVAPAASGERKPAAKYVFTDGSGFMNFAAAEAIAQKTNRNHVPYVVQMRIAGAKGILLRHPADNCDDPTIDPEEPTILLRPSQMKIHMLNPDRSQLTMDLVRGPLCSFPAKLSAEVIVNLSHNGVPDQVFVDLMKEGLEKEVKRLTTWTGNHSMKQLFDAVFTSQGVSQSRMRLLLGALARARGYGEDESDDALDTEEEDDEGDDPVAWTPDEISGQPSSLPEAVMAFLASGFRPDSLPVLMDKLKQILRITMEAYVLKYKISVPGSCTAFVAPDPLNVLEENEIFFRFSRSYEETGFDNDIIVGDVLITRHPCKLPTDVQRVRAVNAPKLNDYKDVILFPTKGSRSLASLLAGGDYDGDTITIIWQPEIVKSFKNADPKYADPPVELENAFTKSKKSAKEFCRETEYFASAQRTREIQKYLLATLKDTSIVGQYSGWHDLAVYTEGYESPEAWRLAYMFCEALDGSKSGLRINPAVLSKDRSKYDPLRTPAWKEKPDDKIRADELNQNFPKRPSVRPFVMDTVRRAGDKAIHQHYAEFDKLRRQQRKIVDAELIKPYLEAKSRAESFKTNHNISGMEEDLASLMSAVQANRQKYRKDYGVLGGSPKKSGPSSPAKIRNIAYQKVMRASSSHFLNTITASATYGFFSPEELKRVAASYAYYVDGGTTSYPFDVAFRELCKIKTSSGPHMTMTSGFYYSLGPHKPFIRALTGPDNMDEEDL